MPELIFEADDLSRADVRAFVSAHLEDMYATSPAESVHALGHDQLREPGVSFWTAWEGQALVACGALKHLAADHVEIKAMRTAVQARGRGVAGQMLAFLLREARARGYLRISLETGTQDYFAAARRLYERNGFVACPPFADYRLDPSSAFMTRSLDSVE